MYIIYKNKQDLTENTTKSAVCKQVRSNKSSENKINNKIFDIETCVKNEFTQCYK